MRRRAYLKYGPHEKNCLRLIVAFKLRKKRDTLKIQLWHALSVCGAMKTGIIKGIRV